MHRVAGRRWQNDPGIDRGNCIGDRRPLLGVEVPEKVNVWHYNLEDPLDELYRRAWAICERFEIEPEELEGRLFLDSGRDRKLIVASRDGVDLIANPAVGEVIEEMKAREIGVLQVDPFIKTHSLDENSNPEVDYVCTLFADIAKATRGSIDLVHHVRKGQPGGAATPGNIDQARGASALSGAVHAARTLGDDAEGSRGVCTRTNGARTLCGSTREYVEALARRMASAARPGDPERRRAACARRRGRRPRAVEPAGSVRRAAPRRRIALQRSRTGSMTASGTRSRSREARTLGGRCGHRCRGRGERSVGESDPQNVGAAGDDLRGSGPQS